MIITPSLLFNLLTIHLIQYANTEPFIGVWVWHCIYVSYYFLSLSSDLLIHFTSASLPKGKLEGMATEKARQCNLKDDPLVMILNPKLVRYQLCRCDIKLSYKSAFNLCHWTKHCERCLKKSKLARQWQRKINKIHGLSCFFVYSTLLDYLQIKKALCVFWEWSYHKLSNIVFTSLSF